MLKFIDSIFSTKLKRISFFALVSILIFIVSKNFGFFDDDILFGSKMGNHLYNSSIFNWNIPVTFDPGHPPFLAFILALFWKIFGHHLWVSHLAMLPFTILFFIQLQKFIAFFIKDNVQQFFAFILILSDPTVATCLSLVNMEVITIAFFFLALNGILSINKKIKFIGLFFLSIVSFRSMLLFAGLCLFEIIYQKSKGIKLKKIINLQFVKFYFLASLPAIIYVLWRISTKGWLQTHSNSPWQSLWEIADANYFFRNCIVLIWRYLDFGRVFIMAFIFISLIKFRKNIFKSHQNKTMLYLSISSVIFITITIIGVTNTVGIRYFIVSYIAFNLLAFLILLKFYKHKKIIFSILFLGLVFGNLWIYPKPISTAFRATLAHVPYHSLRTDAIDFLNKKNINIEETASFFPNYVSIDLIDFSSDQRSFSKFTGKEKYVFYSNVYNLSDDEYKTLENNYIILKEFNNFNIKIIIYILKE